MQLEALFPWELFTRTGDFTWSSRQHVERLISQTRPVVFCDIAAQNPTSVPSVRQVPSYARGKLELRDQTEPKPTTQVVIVKTL